MKIVDDLFKTFEGNWSMPKITAAAAHTLMALMFAKVSFASGFVPEMWMVYGGFAIGHAIADKVGSQVARFKDRRLDAETAAAPEVKP